jgi:hypothetical protein
MARVRDNGVREVKVYGGERDRELTRQLQLRYELMTCRSQADDSTCLKRRPRSADLTPLDVPGLVVAPSMLRIQSQFYPMGIPGPYQGQQQGYSHTKVPRICTAPDKTSEKIY